uniref:Integrase catalytic domain-containing protein n=1 Tax=Amphimedon queenslandica TaxID=400682 RepID=A0A1X7UBB2_AMPQE
MVKFGYVYTLVVLSFKRFAARRGTPRKLVSDNGKAFTAAAKALKAISENKAILNLSSGFRIDWQFNIVRAAWWGGIFERLIRSTKRRLRKIVGKASLTYDELNTAVIEI